MSTTYLVDTNVFSEVIRPKPHPAVMARVKKVADAAMASVTWHELCWGVRRLALGRRRDSFDEYIQRLPARFPVLPYDQRAADWHAAERARLERIGRTPPYLDGQIAAVAATRELILVTRSVRDFMGFTDLRVESWWMEKSS